jgi:hypothetical protein
MQRLTNRFLTPGITKFGLNEMVKELERKRGMDINNIFTYHAPGPEHLPKYEAIRAKAKEMGQCIVDNTPVSADQTAAIRLLREAVMTANAAIALDGKL